MKRVVIFLILFAILAFAIYEWLTFPDVSEWREEHPALTAFMKRRKRQLRWAGKDDRIDYQWVAYHHISPYFRRAVLVSEDSSFYEHEGIDVEGMKEALRRDWESRRFSYGGSTITQQLAKNLYLSPSKNLYRKLKEYLIARQLEKELTKRRILELYMNVVELGDRVFGVEAAARHYFGKNASALTPREAALLAGSLPNPRRMNPGDPNKRLLARQRIILSRMRRWGHLAETQVLTPKPKPLPPEPTPTPEQLSEPPIIDTSVPDTETTETSGPPIIDTSVPEAVPDTSTEP